MKIERIEFAKYRLPLTRPFRVGGADVTERHGRVVRMTSDSGQEAYGEISPLPGLHGESVEDAERVLVEVGRGVLGQVFERFGAYAGNVGDRVAACSPGDALAFPSVCFGLQSVGAGLFAIAESTTPASIWSRDPRPQVELNALFSGGPQEAEAAAVDGSLAHFPAVKVKVGQRSAQADRRTVNTLLGALPEATTLRLDANRSLSLDEAVTRFEGLPPERIEYLEEPLADPGELAELSARTGLRIGLDETLREPDRFHLGRSRFVAAWILKPALVGHWKQLRFLADDAVRHGAKVVISSCLESGLGLWANAQVAAALPGADVPAGLATDPWLGVDLVSPRYDSSRGVVNTADWRHAPAERILDRLSFRSV